MPGLEWSQSERRFALYKGRNIIKSLWYGLAFFVVKNDKRKIFNFGKVDGRIPIIQLARSRSKRQKGTNVQR